MGLPFPHRHCLITPRRRMSKGLYSDARLSLAITGLSYPETHAFPRGARRSRFPLASLPHFCGLISPPAKSRLRRSFSNAPSRGFSPLHVEQGWSALPQLPCPCRPTSMQPSLGCNLIGSKQWCPIAAPVSAAPARINQHAAKAVCSRLANVSVTFVCVCLQVGGLAQ